MSFNSFFREDNFIFSWSNKIVDAVMLSILWVFLSLPIVTAGPATAALYFTVVKCLRGGEDKTYLRLWRSFLGNLKLGIPATLISAAVLLLLSIGLEAARGLTAVDSRYAVLYTAYYCAAVLPVGVVCYLFPLLGRFSFRLWDLLRTAMQLTIRHLLSTVVMVVTAILVVNVCLMFPAAMFLLPSLTMLVWSWMLERIFKKYLPAEPPASLDEEETEEP